MKKLFFIFFFCPLISTAQKPGSRFENDTLYTTSGYKISKGQIIQLASGTAENSKFRFIKYNGGFNLDMWGTIVNRDGEVCAVAFTGATRSDQWPGSRVISAQKANTANAFSLPDLALSTANLYSAVQPGGSLFGLQESNPVNVAAAYKGPAKAFGTAKDPLVGQKIGGVNVFGGGLALYNSSGALVGAIGVSGDSSCADHNIAWRTRHLLGFDHVSAGVGTPKDNIVFDIVNGVSAGGWGHPTCNANSATANTTVLTDAPLPPAHEH
ncbi:MAG: heme-binding protein [Methylococcales bacterium]